MIDRVKIFFACNLVTVQNLVVSDTVLMHVGAHKILGDAGAFLTLDGSWLTPRNMLLPQFGRRLTQYRH